MNFSVKDLNVKGIADVMELVGGEDMNTVNTFEVENVYNRRYTIGIDGTAFGYTLKPFSAVAIRIRTK